VFALALALGAAGTISAAMAITTAIASVHRGATGSGQLVLAGLHMTYPTLNGASALLFAIAALGAASIVIAVEAALRQFRGYRGLIAQLRFAAPLPRDPRVKVIPDPRPQAFCAGYLQPTVYVSRRTVEVLGAAELDAVLAHEHHHRRVRDPLRFACGRILSEALFFLPVLRRLCDRYADLAELSADRAAVRACAGQEAPLASALLVFDESGPPGVTGISPERVDSLLGQPVTWRLPLSLLTASIALLVGIGLLIWGASVTGSAHATFNLPVLSSQPCLAVMTILPFAACLGTLYRSGARRNNDPCRG
jgi:Peptidase family M48